MDGVSSANPPKLHPTMNYVMHGYVTSRSA